MNMGMIKAALLSRSALPPQYQKVEYLQSTGVQWIDTGYIPKSTTRWEMVFATTTIVGQHRIGRFGGGQRLSLYSREGGTELAMGEYAIKNYTLSVGTVCEMILDIPNLYGAISNTGLTWSFAPSTWTNTQTMLLFARNGNNEVDGKASVKIYRNKFFESNVIKQDLIPCRRKSDNKPGMWDTVSKTFFTNTNTGADFIIGPDVI